MLFENRDGATAYAVQETAASRTAFGPLALKRDARSPQAQLEKMLVAHGLYPREAKAMVDSWSGSWFEQGTRVLYILPPDAVDAMLPLRIEPEPVELKRVFVGRIEVATPATLGEVKRALETHDARRLQQYGRFLEPFARRLGMRVPAAAQIFSSPLSGQASRGTCGSATSN
jgi:hypothetical protein